MKKLLRNNIYILLIYRILLLVLLYNVCRALFYMLNTDLLGDISFSHLLTLFWAGLTFDASAIMYINSLYIVAQVIPFRFRYKAVYQKALKIVFCVSNSVFFLFNCADLAYFRFTLRRTTLSVFGEFSNDLGNVNLIGQLAADYWWVLLIWVAITLILVFAYGPVHIKKPIIYSLKKYTITQVLLMLLFIGAAIIFMRGGLKDLPPININHATLHVNKPIESNIVLNTSFTLIRTSNQKSIQAKHYFSDDELAKIYSPIHQPRVDTVGFQAKNVFIIILEGFGKAQIGYYAKQVDSTYTGYTPFLDSLTAQSYGFKYSFANGYISSDAVPAILASLPSLLRGSYVSSIYANNQFTGIGEILSAKGYDCSFYHGAENGSMRFLEFSKQAGFQHYYGRTEYNNEADFDGTWGISDEPFMQYVANVVNTKPEPFLSVLFTLSSHHPYAIPEKYKGVFPKGTADVHESVGYADYALRQFFETVSQMPWFNNTLFVIVADHVSATTYPEFITSTGVLSIPVIFYDPTGKLPAGQNDSVVVQQIDVMPSILDYLNYDKPYFAFGTSVFDSTRHNFAVSIQNGVHQFIHNNYVLQENNDTPVSLYNYVDDVMLKNNLLNAQGVPPSTDSLYKAFIQQYNNRLINNRTILE